MNLRKIFTNVQSLVGAQQSRQNSSFFVIPLYMSRLPVSLSNFIKSFQFLLGNDGQNCVFVLVLQESFNISVLNRL